MSANELLVDAVWTRRNRHLGGKPHSDAWLAEYRKFLALHLAYPDADIVPCKLVDDIWHQHILDTCAYREDCDVIFGRFLDHFPATRSVNPPADSWISPDASSRCKRTACKPQKCR